MSRADSTPSSTRTPATDLAGLRTVEVRGKQRYHEPAVPTDAQAFADVVRSRRSVRVFTDTPIPPEVLDECLDLAMLAPNSSGLQPWEFYVVRSEPIRSRLVQVCMGQLAAKTAAELIVCVARTDRIKEHAAQTLREWPTPETPGPARQYYRAIPFLYGPGPFGLAAPLKRALFALAGLVRPVPRGPYTASELRLWAAKSTALACENLVLALRAHGFDSCMMEGFDEVRLRRLLDLDDAALPIMVVGAGERAPDGVFWPQLRFDRSQFVHEV